MHKNLNLVFISLLTLAIFSQAMHASGIKAIRNLISSRQQAPSLENSENTEELHKIRRVLHRNNSGDKSHIFRANQINCEKREQLRLEQERKKKSITNRIQNFGANLYNHICIFPSAKEQADYVASMADLEKMLAEQKKRIEENLALHKENTLAFKRSCSVREIKQLAIDVTEEQIEVATERLQHARLPLISPR